MEGFWFRLWQHCLK